MAIIEIKNDSEFQTALHDAGAKLVVVDFFATWCGPCNRIAPAIEAFSLKYPNAVFLKVDVDKCTETAALNSISAMPTFVIFLNKTKVDSVRGADPNALEAKIKQYYKETDGAAGDDFVVKGQVDLSSFVLKASCECLNEADDHTLEHALNNKGGYIESDCDEQLIIAIGFSQTVRIHSLKIQAPEDKGPKTIKIFINQPSMLDFDSGESRHPTQLLTLTPSDFEESAVIPLKFVKYQSVNNIMMFVKDNQSNGEVTQIDYLAFYGSPVAVTKMSDFKRVAGKKGESE